MKIDFDEKDFENIHELSEESDTKKGLKISLIASYLYAFGNDVRLMHLYTTGKEFLPYHEQLNELYDVLFDSYDMCAEHAISLGEKIINPANVLDECSDWKPLEGEEFSIEQICKEINERGNKMLENLKNIDSYESFIQSDIDGAVSSIDKIVNYIFKQTAKK